eukprot:1847596-Rhodomonas_salina.1
MSGTDLQRPSWAPTRERLGLRRLALSSPALQSLVEQVASPPSLGCCRRNQMQERRVAVQPALGTWLSAFDFAALVYRLRTELTEQVCCRSSVHTACAQRTSTRAAPHATHTNSSRSVHDLLENACFCSTMLWDVAVSRNISLSAYIPNSKHARGSILGPPASSLDALWLQTPTRSHTAAVSWPTVFSRQGRSDLRVWNAARRLCGRAAFSRRVAVLVAARSNPSPNLSETSAGVRQWAQASSDLEVISVHCRPESELARRPTSLGSAHLMIVRRERETSKCAPGRTHHVLA